MRWGDRSSEWVGRTVISQYGLICDVEDAKITEDGILLTCVSRYNGRKWEWFSDYVSLVTRDNKVLDHTGEIYGEVVGNDWNLYPEEKCYFIPPKALNAEFGG